MPDLTFTRGAEPPVKMACMYCGAPATRARERRVTNPRVKPPELDGRVFDWTRGDEIGCLAVLALPVLLYDLARRLRDEWRYRVARWRTPPLDPPHTRVTVTTCARHHNYVARFAARAALGWTALTAAAVAGFVLAGGADLLPGVLLALLVAFPLVSLMLYTERPRVRVSNVTRDAVTVCDVRQAYFDAPEAPPKGGPEFPERR